MFPYTVKYTESEYNIQNNKLLYKIDQQCKNTFENLKMLGKLEKQIEKTKKNVLFYFIYNLHNSYFANFVLL